MKSNAPSPQEVVYYVTVHGIGEQRPNDTVIDVINRLAEVRIAEKLIAQSPSKYKGKNKFKKAIRQVKREQLTSPVTLGMVTSQTGQTTRQPDGSISYHGTRVWSEYRNIPAGEPSKDQEAFFRGDPSHQGENIRFVDFNWSDILDESFKSTGQEVGLWTRSLIGRYALYGRQRGKHDNWIKPLLETLARTLKVLHLVMGNRSATLTKKIFEDYLGDVQVYGENLLVRGTAVRRFHNTMEKLEWGHIKEFYEDYESDKQAFLDGLSEEERQQTPNALTAAFETELQERYRKGLRSKVKPNYVILAHSLGTVLSMDALVYAHVHKDIHLRENRDRFANLPFPGYERPEDDFEGGYIGANWIDHVSSLVTLGSPIDKFLTLWQPNYRYLNAQLSTNDSLDTTATAEQLASVFHLDRTNRIRHFNYCDEQDPVGHHLDRFSGLPLYEQLFDTERSEDRVFSRYALTGGAHTEYWTDAFLFRRIVHKTVDEPRGNTNPAPVTEPEMPDRPGVYWKVILMSYFTFPFLGTLVSTGLFLWFIDNLETDGWGAAALPLGLSLATVYIFRQLIRLAIAWRQVVKAKNRGQTRISAAAKRQERKRRYRKKKQAQLFRWVVLPLGSVVWIVFLYLYWMTWMKYRTENGIPFLYNQERSMLTGVVILAVVIRIVSYFLRSRADRDLDRWRSPWPDLLTIAGVAGIMWGIVAFFHTSYENWEWAFVLEQPWPSWVGPLLIFGLIAWLFTTFTFFKARLDSQELTEAPGG